jgi:hypothetical protein
LTCSLKQAAFNPSAMAAATQGSMRASADLFPADALSSVPDGHVLSVPCRGPVSMSQRLVQLELDFVSEQIRFSPRLAVFIDLVFEWRRFIL